MISYKKLSEYIKFGFDINPIVNEIIVLTLDSKKNYPNYYNWFLKKHVPGIYAGTRDTIIAIDEDKQQIIGVSNIKLGKEKKICTLYFEPKYRRNKLGIELTRKSIELLECDKPLITMPSTNINQFKNIIKQFNWEMTDYVENMYKEKSNEVIFNGVQKIGDNDISHDDKLILTYEKTKDKNIIKIANNKLYVIFKILTLDKNNDNLKKVLPN